LDSAFGTCERDHADALELFHAAFSKDIDDVVYDSDILASIASWMPQIGSLLADTEHTTQESAARALLIAAQFPSIGLQQVMDTIYSVRQHSSGTSLCSGVSLFLSITLESMASNTLSDDIASATVYFQAALWDFTPMLQNALAGAYGPRSEELAKDLAVRVYLHMGVNESSQLIDGLDSSAIRDLFERFAEAEEQEAEANGETYHVGRVESPASPSRLCREREDLMDEILEEVGVVFHSDMIMRDKIVLRNGDDVADIANGNVEEELFELGLSDDLYHWASSVLVDKD